MSNSTEKTRRLVGMSIFTALVIVLQLVATFVKIGTFPVTLTLVPVVIGAALYGAGVGAWLGFVFGAVVLAACIAGADQGGAILWNLNPLVTAALCLVKGAAAGWVAGLAFKALEKKAPTAGVICAAIASPVVNTGIFCAGLFAFFTDTFNEWMAGWAAQTGNAANPILYIFLSLVGVNFLIEMGINLVLSPIIERIIRLRKKGVV